MPLNWELITPEAIASVELDKLFEAESERDCSSYGLAVAPLLKDEGRWNPAQLEALRFAGAVMSMMLRPEEPSEPYGPMYVIGAERSAIPADFPREGLLALRPWAAGLVDAELRARFLDVIWVQGKSFDAAQGAVGAYIESARRLEVQNSPMCEQRVERALRLAASLGRGGMALRETVLNEAQSMTLRQRDDARPYLALRLVRLLLEFGHGDAAQLARVAHEAAELAEAAGDFWRARDYHQATADCFEAAKDSASQAAALRRSAEALVKEAEAAIGQPGRGALAASGILAQALDAMRKAPGGKPRAEELHQRLLDLQSAAVSEMRPISTQMDSTALVERALGAVRGKSLRDAVVELCRMAGPPSLQQLRKQVEDQARIAVLGSLVHSDIVNSRGRVVAKAPPLTHGATDPNDPGLRVRMFQVASRQRSIGVQAMLNPARIEIAATHNPSRHDVVDLIRHSPWVPPGHLESVARALVAGFHGDMIVASHLVPPQFEALVRHVVESAGASTSKFDAQGLQPEKSLNALLETDEARKAFGEAGLFELQGLFVDQLGANLRNEMAHGLRDDNGVFDGDVLYAWWLLLRYCVATSLHVEAGQRRNDSGQDNAGAT